MVVMRKKVLPLLLALAILLSVVPTALAAAGSARVKREPLSQSGFPASTQSAETKNPPTFWWEDFC